MFLLINPTEWGRHTEKLHQALARLAEVERRQDSLVLALIAGLVAGLFVLAAAIVGALLLAVMSG
jgi:hypothetical protein